MNAPNQNEWIRRLAFSLLFSAVAVGASTAYFVATNSTNLSKAQEIFSDVIGAPLLPGVGFVAAFFGAWPPFIRGN
jgi:hypothetical protein